MTTLAATEREVPRIADSAEQFLERVIRCYTRPDWRIGSLGPSCVADGDGPLDALVLPADMLDDRAAEAARERLLPLGRVIVACPSAEEAAARLEREPWSCSVIGAPRSEDGCAVVIGERPVEGRDFERHVRRDVRKSYYKMSRYMAYQQMQENICAIIPDGPGRVVEIGDSNGVIMDMLGWTPRPVLVARHPPHDLQDLHQVASDSADVFICDNTLEHVADPAAGLREIARVIRPDGHAVFMLPFIAMCQSDDRCRWSMLAFREALSRAGLKLCADGSWGNVEACCAYIRWNKWLRVLAARDRRLICADSRDAGSPLIELPADNDPAHPIHLWAIATRPGRRDRRAVFFAPAHLTEAENLDLQRARSTAKQHYDSRKRSAYLVGHLLRYVPDPASCRMLCVGARNASELECLEQVGFRAIKGIDLHSTDPRIAVMDMHRLEFPEGAFDAVFASHSFEHALDPGRVAAEMRRVLVSGGLAVIEVPTGFVPTGVDLWDYREAETVLEYFQPAELLWSERGPQLDAAHQEVIRLVLRVRKG